MEDDNNIPQTPTLQRQAIMGRIKCMLCGRDKFTRKSAHICNGQFRKRKIVWQLKKTL
jgi:hypothetical protein